MIADLKPYPTMKESGLSWLGDVPEHWECRRNGRLFAQRNESGFGSLPILEVSLKTGVQIRDFESSKRKQVMSDVEKYKRACKGDIAYNMMRMWQGAVGVAPVDGLVSPAYIVARPLKDAHPRYYEYLFRTRLYMDQVNQFSRGIVSDRNRLYWEDFKQMPSPFPPLQEQSAIVRVLDHANRQIRRSINSKQKLIKLLEEQKRVIIHRAVTRGLDSNIPVKASGVEWLGDVPEHWELQKLKRLGDVRIGITYSPGDVCDKNGTLVLRASNIQNGEVLSSDNVYISTVVPENLLVAEGDILICVRSGSRSLVGKSALIPRAFARVTYGAFMSLLKSEHNAFIFWVLNSNLFACVMAQFETSTINQLTQDDLKSLVIPVPSPKERDDIVAYLGSMTATINATIASTRREIDLMFEYRTRVISDVVTGKLDVRETFVRLPEETEEPEPIEESETFGEQNEIEGTSEEVEA